MAALQERKRVGASHQHETSINADNGVISSGSGDDTIGIGTPGAGIDFD